MNKYWNSWNSNISHPYKNLHTPKTLKELETIVSEAKTVRVIGTGRSSADIVAGTDTLISLEKLDRVIAYDADSMEIHVECGITLKDLLLFIESKGAALPCLPDIDCITLGGALATGTHGTGRDGHPISSYVSEFHIVEADGKSKIIGEGDSNFPAYQVSLGVLGVISSVKLKCIELKNMQLTEYPIRDGEWLKNYRALIEQNDFLRILWLPHTGFGYLIEGNYLPDSMPGVSTTEPKHLKHRRKASSILYKFTGRYPILTAIANKLLKILFFNHIKKSYGTLYGATVTKSRGSTLELAEWTIPISRFEETFKELRRVLKSYSNDAFAHIPMDIRYIKKDEAWLSYAYSEDAVTIGCVCRVARDAPLYQAFDAIEEIFLKHGGKPHWAKRFKAKSEELSKLYPKWDDFIKLRDSVDPEKKFLNPYLEALLNR